MVTTYNATSEDGFIARKNGSEDFIPDDAWDDFLNLLSAYDVVVMGRKSYEAIQAYPDAMAHDLEVIPIKRVIVSRDEQFVPKPGYSVTSSLTDIPALGKNVLLTSGPSLNTAAFEAGIIDRVKIMVIPERIGEGMTVFNDQPTLDMVSTEDTPTGRKIFTYSIQK